MNTHEFNSKHYLMSLMLIHGALILGQVVFLGVTYVIQTQNQAPFLQVESLIIILIAAFAVIAILGGNVIFAARLRSLKQETDFSKKLENYRTLSIVRYALLEAPSLLSLVLFFLSSDFFFLMISALLIFLLILIKPSRERLISELEPNPQELELLNN